MSSTPQRYLLPCTLLIFSCFLLHGGRVAAAGKVPAIIVFGDSSVDTGNNNFIPTIARSNFWPYGRDYANGLPTGRFSNGRLATDFISEAFGLPPSIPAYLDTNCTIDQLATGVSFASAATGLDNATAGVLSVITLGQQLAYFKEYTDRLKVAKGEAAAKEIIGEALYIWSIGTNDFIENYYNLPERRMQYTVGEYEAYLLGIAEAAIRRVHALGGRKMDFTGLTPMGCLPAERIGNRDDPGECNEQYNAVARTFNTKLQELVAKLNSQLPGLQLVFADTYQLLAAVVNRPADYAPQRARGRPACAPHAHLLATRRSQRLQNSTVPSTHYYKLLPLLFPSLAHSFS
ncbi:GDSL esterase/lipase At2g42990-like isoform X2 [Panicum hallii]|uniref:GDSL esterase/lipase At2g42990-like isoform X2 n=1 Tax=Panicum hallii TaxID=206008 RepID=UPI000DF4E830|nr:GDSL esterase/lipase At2g42990-like isoform X2 [Panicum hallii]